MSLLRKEVLRAFKELHVTRKQVFQGDVRALEAARLKINQEFSNSKSLTDEAEIKQKLGLAEGVIKELRTNVIQAIEKKPGVFEANIRDETTRLDNYPFDPNAKLPPPRQRKCK